MTEEARTNPANIRTPRKETSSELVHRVEHLELELLNLRRHSKLNICFLQLVLGHAFLACLFHVELHELGHFDPIDFAPAALPVGGVCTLSVWFAWSRRSLWERVARTLAAAFALCVVVALYFPRAGQFVHPLMARLQRFDHHFFYVLCFFAFGTLVPAYLLRWFAGVSISPPRGVVEEKALSIRTVLLTMIGIAAALALLKYSSGNEVVPMTTWYALCFRTGMGVLYGLLAAAVVYAVFRLDNGMLLNMVVAWLVIAAVVCFAMRGQYAHLAAQAICMSTSPLLSFWLMKRYGYRLSAPRTTNGAHATDGQTKT